MAVYEKNVLLTGKDASSNNMLLYPITQLECVDGAEEAIADAKTKDVSGNALQRVYCSMIPYGTKINANADLNTTEMLAVGNYYCTKNADVATLINCPTTLAFAMQVYSPLSTTIDNEATKTWVYRLRKIITHKGAEYYQFVNSGSTAGSFTYGPWVKTATENDIGKLTELKTTARSNLVAAINELVENQPDDVPIQYIESLDDSNLKNLRDLDSGTYILYGYFTPYPGAPDSITINGCLAAAVHLAAGSHVMVYNPRNFKIECYEMLVDDTASDGFTYTRDTINLLELKDICVPTKTSELENDSGFLSVASVTNCGAKGDGSTDDTTAFQTALAENRVVYVPGGTYKLSSGLTIRENCCLELAQDAVLQFTQTSGNAITMLRSASLKGNHATIFVPYTFGGNVINCDTGEDEAALVYDRTLTGDALTTARANANKAAVKPFTHWNPQWKMTRYVTDINICKAASAGYCNSSDGNTYGTAVYLHCDEADLVSYMWGVNMSGVRISGAFNYGIHAYNKGDHVDSWNHDMRIEAVIDACKIGALLDNCYYARLALSVQGRKAENGTLYAEHGIKLVNSRGIDLSSTRIWDWNEKNSRWTAGGQYQHIALIGECRGLILDAFEYYEVSSYDIRELIYTDTPSNLDQMTILQEPIDRWFKVKEDGAYFSDGANEQKLMSQEDMGAYFDTDVVKNFTDVLPTAIDTDKTVFNGVGYNSGYIEASGAFTASDFYRATGFIRCAKGSKIYVAGMSFVHGDSNCRVVLFDSNFGKIMHINHGNIISNGMPSYLSYEETANGFLITVSTSGSCNNVAYIRLSVHVSDWGKYPMVSIDNPIEYTVEGFLADGVKVKASNVVGLSADGSVLIPESLPNPHALTINGQSYDGSKAVEMTIQGGADIDVTAAVGQTIVVKAVDENGKPTEWEAIDLMRRRVLYPQTTFTGIYDSSFGSYMYYQTGEALISGKTYLVTFDGVGYVRTAQEVSYQGMTGVFVGNGALLGNNTGEPFTFVSVHETEPGVTAMLFDADEHSMSIEMLESNLGPYYINVTAEWNGISNNAPSVYTFNDPPYGAITAFNEGREVKLKVHVLKDGSELGRLDDIYTLAMGGRHNEMGADVLIFTAPYWGDNSFHRFTFGSGAPLPDVIPVYVQQDGTLALFEFDE